MRAQTRLEYIFLVSILSFTSNICDKEQLKVSCFCLVVVLVLLRSVHCVHCVPVVLPQPLEVQ